MSVVALIVAAGRGVRAGGRLAKQYRSLAGKPVLAHAVEKFGGHSEIERIVIVIHEDDRQLYQHVVEALPVEISNKLMPPVVGGTTRQNSVWAGLEALYRSLPEIVLVHDAARPFVTSSLIDETVAAAKRYGAAVPGLDISDAVKRVDDVGKVIDTLDRGALRAIQTPQGFRYASLLDAHRRAQSQGRHDFPDDGALAEWSGQDVYVFAGDSDNEKLTHPQDFARAERRMTSSPLLCRVGNGFDVHAFAPDGDHIWLGGIKIEHHRGVLAHSDGDVILHALADAVFGALADGDIGVHFPPSDPRWKDASSDRFLKEAVSQVRKKGGVVDHVDVTLLCETPRLAPHREKMRQRIAEIADLRIEQVSLKATTTEKLGFTGRGEGIAAQATVTLRLPELPT